MLQGVGYALSEELLVDPTTGVPVNGHLDDYKVPTIADVPEIVVDFVDLPDANLPNLGAKGLGEPPIVPTAAAIANAFAHATGRRAAALPLTPRPRAGGARVSDYARPATLDEALELLARDGRRADGRRHRPRGAGRPRHPRAGAPRRPPGRRARRDRRGRRRRPDRRDGDARRARCLAARRAVRRRRDRGRSGRLAAPAQRRHGRREPLPAHALLVLPRRRVALLARRRRHLLRADRRPPQAQPRARRLHLRAPVRPRARARRVRRDRRAPRSRAGDAGAAAPRALPAPDGRRPLARRRSRRASSSPASGCPRRPTRRPTSAPASGPAFSFPLVSVAAARRGAETRLVAAGVANIPVELDPADPLAGLQGTRSRPGSAARSRRSSSAPSAGPPSLLLARRRHREHAREVDEPEGAALGAPPDARRRPPTRRRAPRGRGSRRAARGSGRSRRGAPFERSSQALSASPSTPNVSAGWRIQSIADAIERYWWIRSERDRVRRAPWRPAARSAVTGSSAVGDPRRRVVEHRPQLAVVAARRPAPCARASRSEFGWRPYG